MASHSLQIRRQWGGWREGGTKLLSKLSPGENGESTSVGMLSGSQLSPLHSPLRCLARRSPSFLVSGLASDTLARSLTHPADGRTDGRSEAAPGEEYALHPRSLARPTLHADCRPRPRPLSFTRRVWSGAHLLDNIHKNMLSKINLFMR